MESLHKIESYKKIVFDTSLKSLGKFCLPKIFQKKGGKEKRFVVVLPASSKKRGGGLRTHFFY